MINVILLEKISKLGSIGEIVKVKDGFARNYLLPNKKAIRASNENKKIYVICGMMKNKIHREFVENFKEVSEILTTI